MMFLAILDEASLAPTIIEISVSTTPMGPSSTSLEPTMIYITPSSTLANTPAIVITPV